MKRKTSIKRGPQLWALLALAPMTSASAMLAISLVPQVALAQSPLQQVVDQNRQGMEAYNNLELEQSQRLLQQALSTAQAHGVGGSALARTYLNLGVVAIGGFGDNGRGLRFFTQALAADRNTQLDPLTSTPEMETVFLLASEQAGSGSPGQSNHQASNPGPANTPDTPAAGGGSLSHQAVPEQLVSTAVPVYIEVPGEAAHVYLYYKAAGMREFRRVEMQSLADGFAYEIPCSDIFEPGVDYYVVAFGEDGSPLGFAGTQNAPISVPIVGTRTQPAPALPGRAPADQCTETECPPGMEGCNANTGGGAGMGGSCRANSDCSGGLICSDDLCMMGEGGDDEVDGSGMPRFFFQAGGTLGLGVAQSGMQADTFPESGAGDAYVPSAAGSDCDVGDGAYCVRVNQAGLVPTYALRLTAGYYILERLGLAVFARIQPMAGQGDLSMFLFGARIQVQLTEPAATGFHAHVHAGFSVGQVQIQPPGNEPDAPWIISGLNGIPVGTTLGYRFMKNFGIVGEVDFMFQFPTFMFNTDVTLGLEVGF